MNKKRAQNVTAIASVLILSSCLTADTRNMPQKGASSQGLQAGASAEINRAINTLAQLPTAPSADYQIGAEDLLQITLYNIDADTRTPRIVNLRVSQQGLISLPLIGDIRVARLTPATAEKEIQKQYERYIKKPQVGVLVSEYKQQVSVIGAVQRTGPIPLTGPKTVIDVLSLAGGVTEKAGTQVHIYRQGPNGRESQIIDLLVLASNASLINAKNANLVTMAVQPGDVINVPAAGMFFVDGAVRTPGSYSLGRRYSLTQALATAGGVDRDINGSDITIFRRKNSYAVETINVDLSAVLDGSAEDPQIQEDDLIVVPINSLKYAYQRVFGQILGWGLSIRGLTAAS